MLLDSAKLLRLAVTAMPLATLLLAKVPAVAVPESVAVSPVSKPLMVAVPERLAVTVVS